MNELSLQRPLDLSAARVTWKMVAPFFALIIAAIAAHAQGTESASPDDRAPVEVTGLSCSDVFGLGRSIIIRGRVKQGAMAFGGDVIVEGYVEGDVAAVGGSVIQREGSYIGGDVLVIGGAYHHGKTAPGRNPATATLMYAGYEQELRNMMRNPAGLLSPQWSPAYLGTRLLAVLLWFVISLALTAAMPGAVSRGVARLRLAGSRVAVIGFLGSVVIAVGVPVCLRVLPTPISVLVGMTVVLLLIVAALLGRVVIYAATGRWLQQRFLPEGRRSESVALLLGAGFWTMVLSLPYIWPLVVAGLLVTSLGLALTARYRIGWKRT